MRLALIVLAADTYVSGSVIELLRTGTCIHLTCKIDARKTSGSTLVYISIGRLQVRDIAHLSKFENNTEMHSWDDPKEIRETRALANCTGERTSGWFEWSRSKKQEVSKAITVRRKYRV